MRKAVGAWVELGSVFRLIEELAPTFGRQRAKLISTTELTRASEGSRQIYKASGVVTSWRWETANDEIAGKCPICGPLNGTIIEIDGNFAGFLPDGVR